MFNKSRKQEKKHRTGTIPTDSFSDIAFLLIIYFLVATSLVKISSITADLPAGEKQAQAKVEKTPTVNLRGNEIFFNEKPVSLAELESRLAALDLKAQEASKRVIMLESTRETTYEAYFQALAAISANGGVVAIVGEDVKKQ
jgi:biopolymer transport protein ExbD